MHASNQCAAALASSYFFIAVRPTPPRSSLFPYTTLFRSRPKLLMLDEPTEGIQPSLILEIEEAIRRIKNEMGLAVLLVEQYLDFAERLADAYVIMAKGTVVAAGATRDLHADQVKQHLTV